MSLYSLTENNTPKLISNNHWNYGTITKFNKFYYSKPDISFKYNPMSQSLIKNQNKVKSVIPATPIRISKAKSQIFKTNSNYPNSTSQYLKKISNLSKINKKYSPDILNTLFISKPKKLKKKKISLEIKKYNSFLNDKIKTKTLHLNTFNLINGNNYNIVTSSFMNKPIIKRSIKDIKIYKRNNNINNDSISYSMKKLIEKCDKSSKKAKAYMMTQYNQRIFIDKKENLKEYNKFMKELSLNLSKSKSKSKPKKNFFY